MPLDAPGWEVMTMGGGISEPLPRLGVSALMRSIHQHIVGMEVAKHTILHTSIDLGEHAAKAQTIS